MDKAYSIGNSLVKGWKGELGRWTWVNSAIQQAVGLMASTGILLVERDNVHWLRMGECSLKTIPAGGTQSGGLVNSIPNLQRYSQSHRSAISRFPLILFLKSLETVNGKTAYGPLPPWTTRPAALWIALLNVPVLVYPYGFVCADPPPSCGRARCELSGTEQVVTLVEHVAADGQEQVERQGLQPLTSHRSEASF